jgi:hypothetical protein
MENKFSFVINNTNDNNYVLVATAWTLNEDGSRNEVKSQTFTNLTLSQCFNEQANFIL